MKIKNKKKKNQSFKLNQSIYYPSKENTWLGINWYKVDKNIEILQHRITKATERGNVRAIRHFQRLLMGSLSARLKAVQIISEESLIKNIPGSDQEVWTTQESKYQAALELRDARIKPLLKKEVFKKTVKIPCMSDRALQVLMHMSFLPVVEATSDLHSYGFRPSYDDEDVQLHIRTLLSRTNAPSWILYGNIKKSEECWSQSHYHLMIENKSMVTHDKKPILEMSLTKPRVTICQGEQEEKPLKTWKNKNRSYSMIRKIDKVKTNHLFYDWLLQHTPIETSILKRWFKAGFFETDVIGTKEKYGKYNIERLYPTLMNFTLNGLERYINDYFFVNASVHKTRRPMYFIRYATDFLVIGDKQQLESLKQAIHLFLNIRGLQMNKLGIRNDSEGFDFLGWHFRKYSNGALLCKISKQTIAKHRKEMKFFIKTTSEPEILIPKLNRAIQNWMSQYCSCNNISKVWSSMNQYLYRSLMKWGRKRHSNKTTKWVFNKYWKHINGRWAFSVPSKKNKIPFFCFQLIIIRLNLLFLKNKKKTTFIKSK